MPQLVNRPSLSPRRPYCLDNPAIIRSGLEGRRSLDFLMKLITTVDITTPDAIPIEIGSSSVEESSQRVRRVDRRSLEEAKAVPEKSETSPATIEDKKQDLEELANEPRRRTSKAIQTRITTLFLNCYWTLLRQWLRKFLLSWSSIDPKIIS